MPEGHIGNARTAGRRLGVPDWVRASATESKGSAEADTSTSNIVADGVDADALSKSVIPGSFNLSIAQGIDALAEGDADITVISTLQDATGGLAAARATIPTTDTLHAADSGLAEGAADIPQARATANSVGGDAVSKGSVSDQRVTANAGDGLAEATSDIPLVSTTQDALDADSETRVDIPVLSTSHSATSGVSVTRVSIPITRTLQDATSGESNARADILQARVTTDAIEGDAVTEGSISTQKIVSDAGDSSAEADAGIPLISTTHNIPEADATAEGSTSITTWLAGLGGVVELPDGTPVNGAEVHILRDNDDTKVATTVTSTVNGQDGRWHVTLPGGKTTDPDPEVYSIEVWYRDGPKRDSGSTVYNAENRPFIDTSDPSETDPYTDDFPNK